MTRVLPLGDSEFQPSRRTRVMVFRQICRRMKLRGVYPSASAPKWQKSTEKSGSPRLLLSITPRGSEARSPSLWCDRVAVYSANQKDSMRSCDSARHFRLQKWEVQLILNSVAFAFGFDRQQSRQSIWAGLPQGRARMVMAR